MNAHFRGRIYGDIAETVGATPLVRLARLEDRHGLSAELVGKLEFFNPLASVKDRIGVAMIDAAEREGRLQPGGTIVEATSGNTGIGLAFAAAAKGYNLILTMPESMSAERRRMLKLLGARIELTPASESMSGAIRRANELVEEIPGAILARQFDNPANPAIHENTTAEEIWNDTGGQVDIIVSGIGTGGTITGLGSALKRRKSDIKLVAVEPAGSAVLSGGTAGPHKIQGIGSGFLSKILDLSLLDEILTVEDEDAIESAREIARVEGIPVGISAGAALSAAKSVASRPENIGKVIVVIIPDFAERYVSTALFEDL
jgi:cysteine synthase A